MTLSQYIIFFKPIGFFDLIYYGVIRGPIAYACHQLDILESPDQTCHNSHASSDSMELSNGYYITLNEYDIRYCAILFILYEFISSLILWGAIGVCFQRFHTQ